MHRSAPCKMLYLERVHTATGIPLCAELTQFQRHYHDIIKIPWQAVTIRKDFFEIEK
jgi:hypothetical protein